MVTNEGSNKVQMSWIQEGKADEKRDGRKVCGQEQRRRSMIS